MARATKHKTQPAAAAKASAVKKKANAKRVESISHAATSKRKNIPTAEYQSAAERQEEIDPRAPIRFSQPRARPLAQGETRTRNTDADPQIIWNGARIRLTDAQVEKLKETGEIEIGDAQLAWRGKDQQDWSDLIVNAPPLYIQDKIHPQAIIDDLVRQSLDKWEADKVEDQLSLFQDHFHEFNGLNDPEMRTEFYQHDQYWQNRMILGDSLQVMASLAEREQLRGKVQCIYFDPPYGIKFNSNWQVSTQSRDVKDGKTTDISREPEQVKAFRDTWKDGIHSYLTYLRDRLTVARELLHDSGSIFVQIGDENVHRVRAVMDEVFGEANCVAQITVTKTAGATNEHLATVSDFIVWYARSKPNLKYRQPYSLKSGPESGAGEYRYLLLSDGTSRSATAEELESGRLPDGARLFRPTQTTSQRPPGSEPLEFEGRIFRPAASQFWKTHIAGLTRLGRAGRLIPRAQSISYLWFLNDFSVMEINNIWDNLRWGFDASEKRYVVETNPRVVQRCMLMATDPGDLVLDPTCGSGTAAFVAEQWGRRWITIDTSRVALALARTRMMSARYPFYFLADSKEGRAKEQEVSGKIQPDKPTTGDIRQGFVYERASHIMLKDIANNTSIDDIWEHWQATLEPLRADINKALKKAWEEWEIPRAAEDGWSETVKKSHAAWWEARIARQKEIDASIAKAADVEYLYDRPYEDKSRVRVAGPFTVESLSPHRVIPSGDIELADELGLTKPKKKRRSKLTAPPSDFTAMVIDHLRSAGVHQVEKRDTIQLDPISGWPGEYIGAEGIFVEGQNGKATQRRAAILIGPEFGTLSRVDLVAAAREATEARFDVLIARAFAFDAHASELNRLAALPILKAKMNPDLHMAGELMNTGKGNLFIVFGEPDFDILEQDGDRIAVKINGVDVFDQNTGAIRSGDTKSIAAWFIDTNYNEESFFVRHAYFLGANDPYKSLKTALRAEIDEEAWATLYRDTSRPFARPKTGRIAVKVINHFGDEVMKVWKV